MKNSQEKKQQKFIKYGQIWQLGEHKMLVGDCRDAHLVSKLLDKSTINSIVADIPYGISYVESKVGIGKISKNKPIANDDITKEDDYIKFNQDWIKLAIPHLAKKNSVYIFNCDKMIFALKKATDLCDIYFSQLIIWVKSQATLARKDYAPQHEIILYGWYGVHTFRKAKDKSVLFFPKPHKSVLHPTIKPKNLISHIILNGTKIKDAVYDPFLGSGTTILSCQNTGRTCLGAEIDIEYAETIINRFESESKIKASLIYEENKN